MKRICQKSTLRDTALTELSQPQFLPFSLSLSVSFSLSLSLSLFPSLTCTHTHAYRHKTGRYTMHLDLLWTSDCQVYLKLKKTQAWPWTLSFHQVSHPCCWRRTQRFHMQAHSHKAQVDKEGKESKQHNLFIRFKLNHLLLMIRSSASNFLLNVIAHF